MASDEETTLFGQPVDDYVRSCMGRVRNVLKLSMELQGLQSYSDYQDVNDTLATFKRTISQIMQDVLHHQDISLRVVDERRLQDKFELLRDANDCLLERINSELDDAQGIRRLGTMDLIQPAITAVAGSRRTAYSSGSGQSNRPMVLMASRNVQKPQLFFEEKVDNSAKTPFMPLLTDKPNSMKPLAIMLCITEDGVEYYSHPYEYELQHWSPDPTYLSTPLPPPTFPRSMEDTPLVMVETPAMVRQLVGELKGCQHIAVDVEHHAFRSYLGLTCLIQLSSRTKDYIIDPIKLRGHLTPLNQIFTNPKIVKVIHGADSDVLWLQRDCGLYLVNLFDTHLAAVVLDFPQRSLAALLQGYCNIQADKRYQRADWRIRPLPSDFIEYARQDTHYLLYIHDQLHNLLLERAHGATNLISAVYDRSTALCLKRYEKPVVGLDSYQHLYARSRKLFNNRQEWALRELFLWRDKVAREHDESTDFVLPRHMLLQIAEVLPKEMQGVLACCNPIPSLVKTEQLNIHTIIRDALDQPLHKVVSSRVDVTAPLAGGSSSTYCLHDLSHVDEAAASLPCLLDDKRLGSQESDHESPMFGDLFQEKKISVSLKDSSDLFGIMKKIEYNMRNVMKINSQFLSPFQRYRLYKESKGKLPEFEPEAPKTKKGRKAAVEQQQQQQQSSQSTLEDERVARVREHFLSLTGPSMASQPHQDTQPRRPLPEQDEDRVARLLAHVRSSISQSDDTQSDEQNAPRRSVVLSTVTHPSQPAADDTDSSDDSDSSSSSDDSHDGDTGATDKVVAAVAGSEGKPDGAGGDDTSDSSDDSDSSEASSKSLQLPSSIEGKPPSDEAVVEETAEHDDSDSSLSDDSSSDEFPCEKNSSGPSHVVDEVDASELAAASSSDDDSSSSSSSNSSSEQGPVQQQVEAQEPQSKGTVEPAQKKRKLTGNQKRKMKFMEKKRAKMAASGAEPQPPAAVPVKNKSVKRKSSDPGDMEPFNYDGVNFNNLFAGKKKRGRGGRGAGGGDRGGRGGSPAGALTPRGGGRGRGRGGRGGKR